jgi:hypothetical protein
MSKPLLHVLFSPSAAGTLRHVLASLGRSDRVMCTYDDVSFGPITADASARVAWVEEELGVTGWADVVEGDAPFLATSCAPDVLPVAWISRRDSRSYAGFLWWLSYLGDAPCRIIDVTDLRLRGDGTEVSRGWLALGPSAIPAEEMIPLLGTEVDLGPLARAEHHARWRALTAENAPFRMIDAAGRLVSAPVTAFDPLILSCATRKWQKMARIVGEAMGAEWEGGVHNAGDLVLFSRLDALVDTGALAWRGDRSSIHDCELRLP